MVSQKNKAGKRLIVNQLFSLIFILSIRQSLCTRLSQVILYSL